MKDNDFLKRSVNQKIPFKGIIRIAFLSVLSIISTVDLSIADPIVITSSTTINAVDTTYDNQQIIVDGCTLTINGTHQFESISLINGAKITHSANSTAQVNKYRFGHYK